MYIHLLILDVRIIFGPGWLEILRAEQITLDLMLSCIRFLRAGTEGMYLDSNIIWGDSGGLSSLNLEQGEYSATELLPQLNFSLMR